MKIIEAMKLVKELAVKADDLRKKIALYCANMDFETPTYTDQASQVHEWIQAHHDIIKRIEELKLSVQRTNLITNVTIGIGGKTVSKSIAAWIHRRRELAGMEMQCWGQLTDRNLREGQLPNSTPGGLPLMVKIRRYYDPKERDAMIELYRSEPGIIDRTLEVVNATTDITE